MRFFTPDEANQALAVVRPLAEQIVSKGKELGHAEAALADVGTVVGGNGGGLDPSGVRALQERAERVSGELQALVEELDSFGVQVKDLEQGLIDFPARHPEGETVLLCWHLGEDEVAHWHGVDEGFAGRKPLPF
jgi:hypothetical protein